MIGEQKRDQELGCPSSFIELDLCFNPSSAYGLLVLYNNIIIMRFLVIDAIFFGFRGRNVTVVSSIYQK
jgi:hypothetical protein